MNIIDIATIDYPTLMSADFGRDSVQPPTAQELHGAWYTFTTRDAETTIEVTAPDAPRDTRIGINDEIAPELMSKRIRDWA